MQNFTDLLLHSNKADWEKSSLLVWMWYEEDWARTMRAYINYRMLAGAKSSA